MSEAVLVHGHGHFCNASDRPWRSGKHNNLNKIKTYIPGQSLDDTQNKLPIADGQRTLATVSTLNTSPRSKGRVVGSHLGRAII